MHFGEPRIATHLGWSGGVASMGLPRKMFLLLFLTVALTATAMAATTDVGSFVHVWGRDPTPGLGVLEQFSYTLGPSVRFSEGRFSVSFQYGLDPVQKSLWGTPPSPVESGLVDVTLEELGFRFFYGEPLFLSFSYDRLHCLAEAAECEGSPYESGEWTCHLLGFGAGLTSGGVWAGLEGGIRLWEWGDVAAIPDTPPYSFTYQFSAGIDWPLRAAINRSAPRSVESLPIERLETFDLGCDPWEWKGQSGEISFFDEALRLFVTEPNQRLIQRLECSMDRCVVDADVILDTPIRASHFLGIVLRYEDDENFFAFELRADGTGRFVEVTDGERIVHQDWRQISGYREGDVNHIRVVCPLNGFVVYVNDRRFARIEVLAYREGDIALLAGTGQTPGTDARFDNVTIREIESGIALDPRTERSQEIELVNRAAIGLLSGAAGIFAYREGYDLISYGLVSVALYCLVGDTTHVLDVP